MFRYLIFFLLTIVFAQDALVVESSIVAKGLNKPLLVRFHPETNTMYVIQQTGEIVIVNNDKQRTLKGSRYFMNEEERVFIVSNIKPVDRVYLSIDNTTSVIKTLELIYNQCC